MITDSEFRKDGISFITSTETLDSVLRDNLWKPVEDFIAKPGKNIRSQLVEIGYQLSVHHESPVSPGLLENLRSASHIVECVHAGALIVDDIQDGSLIRRDQQSMHVKYGVPLALNAGNWLYFWALDRIRALELPHDVRLPLTEDCLKLMLDAHYGQAIDLGAALDTIDQPHIASICRSSMELKTSSLMALALRLGAAVGGNVTFDPNLKELGRRLGLILQIFDDVGNFTQKPIPGPSKRWEDLMLKRPSWLWMQVASQASPEEFRSFVTAVNSLPCEVAIHQFSLDFGLEACLRDSAKIELEQLRQFCEESWPGTHLTVKEKILAIVEKLEKAYG